MSRIYVISPAGVVLDKTALRRGVARLKCLGHSVEMDANALKRCNRFAGDDAARLAAIARATATDVDMVMISRGGYGLTRLLTQLPYSDIVASVVRGVKWVGFSDFTALQLALLSQWPTGVKLRPTWAGPTVAGDFGVEGEVDRTAQDCLQNLALGVTEGVGWRLSATNAQALRASMPAHAIGQASLWGGNLTMLTSLLATPYFPKPKQTAGGILFLEEVGEHPYRIERMLTQLHLAGVLQTQQAIVWGHCSDYRLGALDKARGGKYGDKGFGLRNVLAYLQALVRIPVFTGLPFGHLPQKVCLPVGQKVNLVLKGREVLLLWGHAH